VNTGLRISECCALTWDRVFLGEEGPSYIFIDRGKSKKARRCIPLTEEARKILEQQKTISQSNFVFVRFGERVKKTLWYVAALSRYTVSEQFSAREMKWASPGMLCCTRHGILHSPILVQQARMRLQYRL
jgi:integrase